MDDVEQPAGNVKVKAARVRKRGCHRDRRTRPWRRAGASLRVFAVDDVDWLAERIEREVAFERRRVDAGGVVALVIGDRRVYPGATVRVLSARQRQLPRGVELEASRGSFLRSAISGATSLQQSSECRERRIVDGVAFDRIGSR